MFYSISGKCIAKGNDFLAIEAGGIGFKINATKKIIEKVVINEDFKVFCYWHGDSFEIYGFPHQEELSLFQLLISISGIGPKMALKIMNLNSVEEIQSAIALEKPAYLSDKGGVSVKTASKIVLELKDKIIHPSNLVDLDKSSEREQIENALSNLGYQRKDIQKSMTHIPVNLNKIEDKIKFVLKHLASR